MWQISSILLNGESCRPYQLHRAIAIAVTDFGLMTQLEVRLKATHLVNTYPDDLEMAFVDEFVQFTSIIESSQDKSLRNMSKLMRRDGGLLLASFPNVAIALRIHLTIRISNCEGERSFSTLSRVKNHLRATMSQDRLDDLAVMSIESDLLRALDVTALIDDFAHEKSRQRTFLLNCLALLVGYMLYNLH